MAAEGIGLGTAENVKKQKGQLQLWYQVTEQWATLSHKHSKCLHQHNHKVLCELFGANRSEGKSMNGPAIIQTATFYSLYNKNNGQTNVSSGQ
jgi:hypothetical protein